MEYNHIIWLNHEKKGIWEELELTYSLEEAEEFIYSFLDSNIKSRYKCSIFKIAKVGDTAWINYLPSNIMKGGK